MDHYLCVTCGTQYGESATAPEHCRICEDDRQYVNPAGQQWTTLAAEQGRHTNTIAEIAPGILTISTEPKLGIGERAHLLQTEHGNILWDCIAYLDDDSIAQVRDRGGIAAIAISHPHFFTTMVEWSRAFGDAPIYLHADHAPWVMRTDAAVRLWQGETVEVLPGATMLRCGGHFPGSSVLHWPAAEGGQGALFTGDTIKVVADTHYVTFIRSSARRPLPSGMGRKRRSFPFLAACDRIEPYEQNPHSHGLLQARCGRPRRDPGRDTTCRQRGRNLDRTGVLGRGHRELHYRPPSGVRGDTPGLWLGCAVGGVRQGQSG